MATQFQIITKGFSLKHKAILKNWLKKVAEGEGYQQGELTYVFCDDNYLLNVNQEFLAHDYFTDIITFDYCLPDDPKRSGDLLISVERVKDNALKEKVTFDNELHRVMVHGLLHLCGYKDKNKTQKANIRKQEDKWLKVLKKARAQK